MSSRRAPTCIACRARACVIRLNCARYHLLLRNPRHAFIDDFSTSARKGDYHCYFFLPERAGIKPPPTL